MMLRVLVVEDNVDIGWLFCYALCTVGWATDFVYCGLVVLDCFVCLLFFDFVLLDYWMLELTGEDVLCVIRVYP